MFEKQLINVLIISFLTCVIVRDKPVYAFPVAQNAQLQKTVGNGRELLSSALVKYGDPGWVKKMMLRKSKRRSAILSGSGVRVAITDVFNLPVLLCGTTDRRNSYTNDYFKNHLFANNPLGTMTDYYEEISYGQFRLTGDVHGWFSVSSPLAYYSGGGLHFRDYESYPENVGGLLRDALLLADQTVDFSQYDNDGPDGRANSGDDDGYVDAVMLIVAGGSEASENRQGLGAFQSQLGGNAFATNDLSANGDPIRVDVFIVLPELGGFSTGVEINPVGTACHEFGHVLGLPDLYDLTGKSYGIGTWCLMGRGADLNYKQVSSHMSAWCKSELGWITPVEVIENGTISIGQVETDPVAYKIWEDGYRMSRYFLLENRQQTGFDQNLRGSGLLIYHVDEYKLSNNDESHKLVDLEEADGRNELDSKISSGDAGDPFPGSSYNRIFDDNSNPDSRDYTGHSSGIAVRNISNSGPTMTADVNVSAQIGYGIVYDLRGITGHGLVEDYPGELFWGGVFFTAREAGTLTALDVGFINDSTAYEIKVYGSFSGSSPQDLLSTFSGDALEAGWHTLEIEPEVHISENQSFFVTIRTDKGIYFDGYSEFSGRSYFSNDEKIFVPLKTLGYDNFNLRARIKYATNNITTKVCDFNQDGAVDTKDITASIRFQIDYPDSLKADFNGDGKTNIVDTIARLLAHRTGTCMEDTIQ